MSFPRKVAKALRAEGFRISERLLSTARKRICDGKYTVVVHYADYHHTYWFSVIKNTGRKPKILFSSLTWSRFHELLNAMNWVPEELTKATNCALENISSDIIDYMEGD